MPEFLNKILATTREDLELRKAAVPLDRIKEAVFRRPRSLKEALASPGMSIIAEFKRASPSKGVIRADLEVAAVVADYENAGANAVSILTEERHFQGSLADLETARSSCSIPLLRKDFIIDPYQVWEAAAAGADAVLLIVAALSPNQLDLLYREAAVAGLECLIEVHDREELDRALTIQPGLIGINNRDLKSFEVNLETTTDLIKFVPEEVLVVSESGIGSNEDVALLAAAGVQAVLVGESLMRSTSPGEKISELLAF